MLSVSFNAIHGKQGHHHSGGGHSKMTMPRTEQGGVKILFCSSQQMLQHLT